MSIHLENNIQRCKKVENITKQRTSSTDHRSGARGGGTRCDRRISLVLNKCVWPSGEGGGACCNSNGCGAAFQNVCTRVVSSSAPRTRNTYADIGCDAESETRYSLVAHSSWAVRARASAPLGTLLAS
eukprot:3964143-Pleurochrysis_carterae.AAC.3